MGNISYDNRFKWLGIFLIVIIVGAMVARTYEVTSTKIERVVQDDGNILETEMDGEGKVIKETMYDKDGNLLAYKENGELYLNNGDATDSISVKDNIEIKIVSNEEALKGEWVGEDNIRYEFDGKSNVRVGKSGQMTDGVYAILPEDGNSDVTNIENGALIYLDTLDKYTYKIKDWISINDNEMVWIDADGREYKLSRAGTENIKINW